MAPVVARLFTGANETTFSPFAPFLCAISRVGAGSGRRGRIYLPRAGRIPACETPRADTEAKGNAQTERANAAGCGGETPMLLQEI